MADRPEATTKRARVARRRSLAVLLGSLLAAKRAAASGPVATGASATSAGWSFPAVIFSSLLISWGAEAAQFFMPQGAALAILAWLQTLPEYAVEFVIAKTAAQDEARTHFMIANLTGSLRLLVGLGWPLIYFTAMGFARKRKVPFDGIALDREHSLEVVCLLPAVLYWFVIYWKRTLTIWDAIILFTIYAAYLWSLRKVPPQEEEKLEDADPIARFIVRRPPALRTTLVLLCFAGGGVILYFTASPFLESMLALAVSAGISQFVFIQWLAPFLSEFPEKLSAFNWARKIKTANTAVMNMVSSNFNQWTVLAATLPLVFSFYSGRVRAIEFDDFQAAEILLTLSQSTVGMVLLLNMHFSTWEAAGIFVLWVLQFAWPDSRHLVAGINFGWAGIEIFRAVATKRGFPAFAAAASVLRGNGRR